MKRAVITGVTGTLGAALARHYLDLGWEVIGVGRNAAPEGVPLTTFERNPQLTRDDARRLLELDADLVILNAGQIETAVAAGGLPLPDATDSINQINYIFPTQVGLEAALRPRTRRLDVVAIGSIADGSPSCFGPIYHASKVALHYFVSGVGPIAFQHNPNVRLRLYRPGVIKGPLSWSPVIRLNAKAYGIRARRCERAPHADIVAARIATWIGGDAWVGRHREPVSFQVFKFLYALAPDLFYRLQLIGWRQGSRFALGEPAEPAGATVPITAARSGAAL